MNIEESKAGKALGAAVILNPKGVMVARVLYHYGNSVTVNVHQTTAAAIRCAEALEALGLETKRDEYGTPTRFIMQARTAGGYGYDKKTAALAGMWIDGHHITNHCERDGAPKPPRGRKSYPADKKPPKGYSYANFASGPNPSSPYNDLPEGEAGYVDCYRLSGLGYLEALGYRVIHTM